MRDVVIYLSLWNLVVFSLYGIDKRRAMRGQWRLSERTLLLSTICLGGLGAFLGAKCFRHKVTKWYFHLSWWLGMLTILALAYSMRRF